MTDAQIVMSIMQNDSRGWRHICRNMKQGFTSIIGKTFSFGLTEKDDIEDIFQDACLVLMQKVKGGEFTVSHEGSVFNCLVQIGKLTAFNLIRKKRSLTPKEEITITVNLHEEDQDVEMSLDEKQRAQDEFLDRVFSSIPPDCQMLLKRFYWDHKPMDEIASILGLRNADTAKTKKNRCMKKFKDIASMLLESDEFAEEAVRAAVERAALKELLEEERTYCETPDITIAALDSDDKGSDPDQNNE